MNELNKAISHEIDGHREGLAGLITERMYKAHPELNEKYGETGRAKCHKDAEFHLSYLSPSIALSNPDLFSNYIKWVKVVLAGRKIPTEDLAENLIYMRETLLRELSPEHSQVAVSYIEEGLKSLPSLPSTIPSFINNKPHQELTTRYLNALLNYDRISASKLVMDAVNAGIPIKEIYLNVFQNSQYEIGRLWQLNSISVAQEHYCTAATQMIMSQLYPIIFDTPKNGLNLVAAGVAGELHEIGLRMVSDFFEMAGWDTFYLGTNMPTESLLKILEDRRADLLIISATMIFNVKVVADLIAAVRAVEKLRNLKILVGGYPFNVAPGLWKKIDADGYGKSAQETVHLANQLVNSAI